MKTLELANKFESYVINMRREFHMFPELSLQETRTSRRIQEELAEMGISYEVRVKNVIATIKGNSPGKKIALRADMDALPIQELNDVSYKSKNDGVMHACAHDAHSAMLLGAAKILNGLKDEFSGEVKLCFQQAEEVGKGHDEVLAYIEETGGVDEAMAMHLWPLPIGKISVEEGPRQASADMFKITVKGQGGHGSRPDMSIDPVKPAAQIMLNIAAIPANELSPLEIAVVHPCKLDGGTAANIFAHEATIEGGIRTFSEELREKIPPIIKRIAEHTARAFGAEAELEMTFGLPAVVNHKESSERAEETVKKLFGPESVGYSGKATGSENFGFYVQKYKGLMAYVGMLNEEKGITNIPHHPNFDIDEDVLKDGMALYSQYALDFLNGN